MKKLVLLALVVLAAGCNTHRDQSAYDGPLRDNNGRLVNPPVYVHSNQPPARSK